jgi:putative membrane protein
MSAQEQHNADPDSRARTHLASERTFLAWLRTGVTLVALGIASAQFLSHAVVGGVSITRGIAVGLVAGGVFLTLVGARRYSLSYRRIEKGAFEPALKSVIIATVLMLAVGVLAGAFIILLYQ